MATSARKSPTTPRKSRTSRAKSQASAEKNGKLIYTFHEGNASMRSTLGGKGAGLAEMTNAGLPVPPGFTITTEACNAYYTAGKEMPPGLWDDVVAHMRELEKETGKGFGNPENPLLVSVRSGAAFSMPGMMDTVLNLGLNPDTVQGLIKLTGNERFAWDAWRRFVAMFGRIVLGLKAEDFDEPFDELKEHAGAKLDTDLTADQLRDIGNRFTEIVQEKTGEEFPTDPYRQLELAVRAVFDSWFGKRAHDYREFNKIPHDLGTAVNVVTMVFGNMGDDSGTGVAFTRDPNTGEKALFGEYLTNAQGEDVVAGVRTPDKISQMRDAMPEVYAQFEEIAQRLEGHYRDMQDLEFTIERGTLYMLQTRSGKRTAPAAVKIAVDMVNEGVLTKEEALQRVDPAQIVQLLLPRFDETAKEKVSDKLLGKGLNASPGAAVGQAIFNPDRAVEARDAGNPVILVRIETSPDDVHGMLAAKGVLTARGGATSHAAVVARSMGLPCVAGAESLRIDYAKRQMRAGSVTVEEGDMISIDGTTGEIYAGELPTIEARFEDEHDLATLLSWADEARTMQVWANADYPRDAERARAFGAQGIGLCRTEHMFFEEDRLPTVRRMILNAHMATAAKAKGEADWTDEERAAIRVFDDALASLEALQTDDFAGLFRAMDGLPVVIRLIDPPLHEFLPSHEELVADTTRLRTLLEVSGGGNGVDAGLVQQGLVKLFGKKDAARAMRKLNLSAPKKGDGAAAPTADRSKLETELAEKEELLHAVEAMREQNPMLGLRGVRLGLMVPDIVKMQTRAILAGAARVAAEGLTPLPEIMIPLVGHVNELRETREILEAEVADIVERSGQQVDYKFGTMIEVPRGALTADEIAEHAEFFSFGTNDLTQMGFGYSRDDAEGKFLMQYVDRKVLPENPFQVLDVDGIGVLVRMGVEKGRAAKKDLKIGICGEHGGDPQSIAFCHEVGLNYVSCSPFRVPVARLAAAQAAIATTETRDK
ncbi:MAG TPA: pyruvate, phosphate dikinase [Candidatus Limnocylindrales bacterium]|nr:pyruvate, phosphate dikinase [Candidatus Limnocylindrales bacterium]